MRNIDCSVKIGADDFFHCIMGIAAASCEADTANSPALRGCHNDYTSGIQT